MIQFADYDFYVNTYCKGRTPLIDSNDLFDNYAVRESHAMINSMRTGYVLDTNQMELVKMCCCDLCENELNYSLNTQNTTVTSEKTGSYSVTYGNASDRLASYKKQSNDIIRYWLLESGLLYKGLY